MKTLLRDSLLCRLCCEESPNGVQLFDEKTEVCHLVNKYLPVNIIDDGSLPTTICQGCYIHVRDIASFHDLIDEGQNKIKSLHEKEIEYLNSLKDLPVKIEDGILLFTEDKNDTGRQSKIASGMDVLEFHHNLDSNKGESSNQGKETESAIKRKRGRPKKSDTPAPVIPLPLERSVRNRKQPSRFSEMFQGKELENVLIKENITNETELDDERLYENEVEDEQADQSQSVLGVIGWIQTKCGKTLGNVISKKKGDVVKGTSCITRLQCTTCEKEYSQKGVLLRHLLKDDCGPPGITYDDIICPTFNITTTVQEMHLLTADIEVNDLENLTVSGKSKKKYVCLLCQKSFPKKCSLVYHEEKEHTHHIFTCSTCDKHFKHRLLLLRHQKCHEESRPYVCDICSLSFKYPSNLNLHKLSHSSSGRFTCSFCSALFNTKNSLELHIRVHLGYKPYQCSVCQKSFSQKNNLQEHFRIHSGEKPFKCTCCFKEFKTSSQLRTHMLTHSEVKPYPCEVCPKSFRHKDSYTAHIRRHTGEKPFACNHCGKSFQEGSSAKKHERLHTGEKRFACKHCDKPFADSSNLSKHRKKVHGDGLDNLARVIYLNLDLPNPDLQHLDIGTINEESHSNNLSVLNLALGQCESELQASSLPSKNLPLVFKTLEEQNMKEKDLNMTLSDIQSQLEDTGQINVPMVLKSLGSNVEGKHDNQIPIFSAENMPLVLKSLEESTCRGKDMPLVLDSVVNSEDNSNQSLNLQQDRITLALSSHQSQMQDLKDFSGLVESSRQIVTDSQGIPIKITLSDGTQLQVTTTDGESLEVITNSGVPIPVRLSGPSEYLISQSLPSIDSLTMEGALNDLSNLSQDYEVQFVEGHSIKLLSSSTEPMKLLSSSSDGEQDDQNLKLLTAAQHSIDLLEQHQSIKLLPSGSEDISSSNCHSEPDISLLSSASTSSLKLLSSRSSSRTNTSLFMTDCHPSNILYNSDHE